MTVRVTLRLPESMHERLRLAGQSSGRSLSRVIVDLLSEADLAAMPPAGATPQELLNWALRGIVRPWTEADDQLMAGIFGEDDAPVLSHEELRAAFPPLIPPLSDTVIALREDRL